MPHRLAIDGTFKLIVGAAGSTGSFLSLLAMDPDHAKAAIVAIGGGFLILVYLGMRDLVPAYVGARKALKQMNIDLLEMDRKLRHSDIKAEVAIVKAADVEAEATQKRHDLADRLNDRIVNMRADLEESRAEVARLRSKLGATEETHVEAINANSENIQTLAEHMRPPIPVQTPHLEPSGEHEAAR